MLVRVFFFLLSCYVWFGFGYFTIPVHQFHNLATGLNFGVHLTSHLLNDLP
ncbi:MAG: hypothetical protein ACI9SQ_001539 [Rubritalea sp.]